MRLQFNLLATAAVVLSSAALVASVPHAPPHNDARNYPCTQITCAWWPSTTAVWKP